MKSLAWTVNLVGGVNETDEKNIVDYLKTKTCHYAYSIEHASQRHMHIAVLVDGKNGAKLFREYMYRHHPDRFPEADRLTWLKSTTWYQESEEEQQDDVRKVSYRSWMEYIQKDGSPLKENTLPENFNELLAPNKSPEERRKRNPWPEMEKWEGKFVEHELPFTTFDQVDKGIAMLCFVHRVMRPPDATKLKGFTMYLWKYLNKDGSGTLASVTEYTEGEYEGRKRRRLETDEKLRVEFVSKYWNSVEAE